MAFLVKAFRDNGEHLKMHSPGPPMVFMLDDRKRSPDKLVTWASRLAQGHGRIKGPFFEL